MTAIMSLNQEAIEPSADAQNNSSFTTGQSWGALKKLGRVTELLRSKQTILK